MYLRVGPRRVHVDPRLWRVAWGRRGTPVTVRFVPEQPLPPIEVAADRIRAAFDEEYELYAWSALPSPPVAFPSVTPTAEEVLIEFDRVDSQNKLRMLLQGLVPRMDKAELEGRLLPATTLQPHLKLPLMPVNAMVAGIVLPSTMDAAGRPPTQNGWYVSDELTDRFLQFGLDWIRPAEGQTYIESNSGTRAVSPHETADGIRAELYPITQVSAYAFNDIGYRRLTLSDHGHVNLEIAACNEIWQPAVAELADALRQWGSDARYGLIRRTQGPGPGWAITIGTMPPEQQVAASHYVTAPGLEDSLVADAYGIQLVTSQHLNRIHVPDTWTVEAVAKDRYLLTAPELDQWFGLGKPNWRTLNNARDLFSDALMRNDDVIRVRQAPDGPSASAPPDPI
jgi:hypothetical protein